MLPIFILVFGMQWVQLLSPIRLHMKLMPTMANNETFIKRFLTQVRYVQNVTHPWFFFDRIHPVLVKFRDVRMLQLDKIVENLLDLILQHRENTIRN